MHAIVEFMKQGSPPYWVQGLALLAYMHIEWWWGRTDKTKGNSVWESFGNFLKAVLVHRIPLIGKFLTAMASKPEAPAAPAEGKPPEESKP